MNKPMEDVIRFISGELQADPQINKAKLIQEACNKYDLDPMQEEFLVNKYLMNQ
ncbi:MAG TPA: hypothetical protein PK926_00895 [Spirochaetota bacterium]|nr:hypothetical protein [Spirochaetota bacterium]HPI87905.1 hypothetical protein [Spirochaetota bacterium]HPR47363.1 hypothetical protein [Spirochaetota bacterium]